MVLTLAFNELIVEANESNIRFKQFHTVKLYLKFKFIMRFNIQYEDIDDLVLRRFCI